MSEGIAALGISNFRNASLLLGDKTRPLILCADQDGEGSPSHKAVEKAVAFLTEEGLAVSVIRPDAVHGKEDFNDILKREGIEGVRKYFKGHLRDDGTTIRQEFAFKDVLMSLRHDKSQLIENDASEEKGKRTYDASVHKDRQDVQDAAAGKEPAPNPVHPQLRQPADPNALPQEKAAVELSSSSEEMFHNGQEFARDSNVNPDKTGLIQNAHSLLEKIRHILPEEAVSRFEASLSDKTGEIIGKCNDVTASYVESIKLESDVSTFIELAEKTCNAKVILSGEIRTILPLLERIVEERQDDEKFAERLKASGHRTAFEIFNSHVDDLKYAQSQSQEYGIEI